MISIFNTRSRLTATFLAVLTISTLTGCTALAEEEAVSTLSIPDLVTQNASDASDKLSELGFLNVEVQDATPEGRFVLLESNWQVCSVKPNVGTAADPETTIVLLAVKNSENCPSPSEAAEEGTTSGESDAGVAEDSGNEASSLYGAQTEEQKASIDVISKYKAKYESASNDLQRAAVRLQRDDAICKANGGSSVKNWTGVVKTIGGTSEGLGYLTVEIADGVTIETWNNEISDSWDNTLIQKKSGLYKTLLGLTEGQIVKFSGNFVPADESCLNTKNLTEYFAIYSPEFVFKFSALGTE